MRPVSLEPLKGFLRAAKGRSQELIIVEFLMSTVVADPISDHGSVLINHPRQKKLIVFNEGDFLFEKKLLDPNARAAWPAEFNYFEGIAGKAFRERETQVYSKSTVKNVNQDFLGQSPIQNMICIPIITSPGAGEPFGVVCFHNNDSSKVFSTDDIDALEAYVDVLAIALHTPHPELQLEKNVFIVHGHDLNSLNELQILLMNHNVVPKILFREDKGPKWLLQEIEDLIRVCKAGFILATPDDEGRIRGPDNSPLQARARENVIFETGLLFAKFREFDRVALLLKRPLTLPTDLTGLAYDEFDKIVDIELKIVMKLKKWGLN